MTSNECLPLHTFHLMGKKDFIPILEEFYFTRFDGFNSLTRHLQITPRQLSLRLKEMESASLLEKKENAYVLTSKGKELGELIQHIKGFHSRYHEGYQSCAGKPCSECVQFVQIRKS